MASLSNFGIDQRARKCLARALPDEWSLSPPTDDLGLDYWVQISTRGKPTGLNFFIQLKGSTTLSSAKGAVCFSLRSDRIVQYLKCSSPVLFVVCKINDGSPRHDVAYFCWIRDYVRQELEGRAKAAGWWSGQKTTTLKLPPDAILTHSVCHNSLLPYVESWQKRHSEREDQNLSFFHSCYPLALAIQNLDEYFKRDGAKVDPEHRIRAKQLFVAGRLLQESGKHDEAIAFFLQAQHIAETPDACLSLGFSYDSIGDATKSLEVSSRGLELDPNNALLESNVGTSYFRLGNPSMALRYHEAAARRCPLEAFFWVNAAATLEFLGTEIERDRSEFLLRALAYYQRADILRPHDDFILTDMGLVLTKLCMFREAYSVLERAVAANPNNTVARLRLARSCVFTQRFDEAKQIFDDLAERGVATIEVLKFREMLKAHLQG